MSTETLSESSDLAFSVAAMAKVGGCWSPSFSPDGQTLAFVSNLSGLPQVWTVSAAGGWPQQVTGLDDQVLSVHWSPDGRWLAFSLAPGGGMNQQVYLIRPDGTGLRRLTDGGKETNHIGDWTHDGRYVSLGSNRRNPDAIDAYLVDAASGKFRLAAPNKGIGGLTDVSADNARGLLYRLENRGSSDIFLVDFASGAEYRLTPHEGPGNFTEAKFAPDGQTIYLTSDQHRDQIALARTRLDAAGQPGALEVIAARDDAGLDTFALAPDGQTALLVWNAAGRSELAFLDLNTLAQRPGPQIAPEVIETPTYSADGTLLAFEATGSASPREIWVYDLRGDQARQVTFSPHPGIVLDTLVQPELVRFPAHDGLELTAWLYRPTGFQAPGAVVLSFHGGPEGQERPNFSATYQALLTQGIAILAPNVRGSGGFGKTFVNLDNGALRVNAVRDIDACARYVLDAGIAAPGRLGIMGGSYGGYMTMAGLSEYPTLFSAGVNLFGVVNFKTFFEQTEPWMAAISKIEYGDPDTEAQMLYDLSPINKIDRVVAPTLVLHGANDTNVPVVEAEQVAASLKRRGVPVEYVLFPDEGHGFLKVANRITATVTTVAWFVKFLGQPAG